MLSELERVQGVQAFYDDLKPGEANVKSMLQGQRMISFSMNDWDGRKIRRLIYGNGRDRTCFDLNGVSSSCDFVIVDTSSPT